MTPRILVTPKFVPWPHSALFLMSILCMVSPQGPYLKLTLVPTYLPPTFAILVSNILRTHFSLSNPTLGLHVSTQSPQGTSLFFPTRFSLVLLILPVCIFILQRLCFGRQHKQKLVTCGPVQVAVNTRGGPRIPTCRLNFKKGYHRSITRACEFTYSWCPYPGELADALLPSSFPMVN